MHASQAPIDDTIFIQTHAAAAAAGVARPAMYTYRWAVHYILN